MDIRDYMYRGQLVCNRYLVVNCEIIRRSTCWVSRLAGADRKVIGDSQAEIETKIDEVLDSEMK